MYVENALSGLLGSVQAVIQFGFCLDDGAVEYGLLYTDIAIGSGDGTHTSVELGFLDADAFESEGGGAGQDQASQLGLKFRRDEYGEQDAGAVLLHLDRDEIDIACA